MSARRNKSKPNLSVPSAAKVKEMQLMFPEIAADVCEEILRSTDWNVERAICYLRQDESSSHSHPSSNTQERFGDWPTLATGFPSSEPNPAILPAAPRVSVVQMNKLFPEGQKVQSSPAMGDPKPQFKVPQDPPPKAGPWNSVLRTSMYSSSEEALREEMKFHTSARVIGMITPQAGTKVPKVLIILRGVPGSGKSRLAEIILGVNGQGIKCSADDHFVDKHGQYVFKPAELGQAHEKSQRKCSRAMEAETTPIIVDNTNTQAWEMTPYVKLAIKHGYKIELLEPNTPWKRNADTLSKKNSHGVPKAKIKQMLERWENITSEKLESIVMTAADPKFIMEVEAAKAERARRNLAAENNRLVQTSELQTSAVGYGLQSSRSSTSIPSNGQTSEAAKWTGFPTSNSNSLERTRKEKRQNVLITSHVDSQIFDEKTFKEKCSLVGSNVNDERANEATIDFSMLKTVSASEGRRNSLVSNSGSATGFEQELENVECGGFLNNPEEAANALLNLFPTLPVDQLDEYMGACGGDLNWCTDLLLDGGYEMKGSFEGPRQSQRFKPKKSLSSSDNSLPASQKNVLFNAVRRRSNGSVDEVQRCQSVPPGFTKNNVNSSSSEDSIASLSENIHSTRSPITVQEPELFDPIDGEDWFDLQLSPDFVTQVTAAYSDLASLDARNLTPDLLKIRVPPKLAFELFEHFSMAWLRKSEDFLAEPEQDGNEVFESYHESRDDAAENLDVSDDEIIAQVIQMEELTSSATPDLEKIMALEAKLAARDKVEVKHQLTKLQFTFADKLKLDKLRSGFPSLPKSEIEVIYSRCQGSYDDALKTLRSSHGDKFVEISDVIENKPDKKPNQTHRKKRKERKQQSQVYSALNTSPTYVPEQDEHTMTGYDWRHVAAKHHMLRADCQAQMKDFKRSGGKPGGTDYYLQKINFHTEQMVIANSKASKLILEALSDRYPDGNTLDLHHLFVREAVDALEDYLYKRANYINNKMIKKLDLKIITGVGNNSQGKTPRIAPAVVAYLKRKHLSYIQMPGTVVVTLRHVDTKSILRN